MLKVSLVLSLSVLPACLTRQHYVYMETTGEQASDSSGTTGEAALCEDPGESWNQYIPDAKLRIAICNQIDVTNNGADCDITCEKALSLTSLDATDSAILSITGIDYLQNLQSLDLHNHPQSQVNNSITDITALGELSKLQSLNLSRALDHADFQPLQKLILLTNLNISHCDLYNKDLIVINKLINLVALDIGGGWVTDVQSLQSLPKLKKLILSNQLLENLNGLEKFTDLEYIEVTYNNVKDIQALNQLTEVRELRLNNNAIEDITALSSFTDLNVVTLWRNDLDQDDVLTLSQMNWLNIGDEVNVEQNDDILCGSESFTKALTNFTNKGAVLTHSCG